MSEKIEGQRTGLSRNRWGEKEELYEGTIGGFFPSPRGTREPLTLNYFFRRCVVHEWREGTLFFSGICL